MKGDNMSYSFGMFFKQINEIDVLPLFQKACKIIRENAEDVLEDNKYSIPSFRSDKFADIADYVNKAWLLDVLSLNFVYWKDKNLLALCGYNYPQELKDLFDCHISFQNSCDQDYEYDEWSDSIEFFAKCKEFCKNKQAEELLKEELENGIDWHELKDIEKHLEYYRKSNLYDTIYNGLKLDLWLYGKEDDSFVRFRINAIDCSETRFEMQMKLKLLIKEMEKEME